jgi:putative ABC transport system permease protein
VLLLVACINFITLSIGRSTTRATEVGVRKALGAARKQLIKQFWGEALLVTILSVLIGVLGAALLLKPFNQLINRDIVFHLDALFALYCIVLICVIALIAGIYPAIILSSFNPVEVLKGKLNLKNDAGFLRKALIVGQFAASIILIICTVVVGRQIHYLQGKDLGYNKDQVIIIPTNQYRAEGYPLAKLFKNELTNYPEVISASAAAFSFAEAPWASLGYTDNNKQFHSFKYNEVDAYFIRTMQIEMAQGRGFSPENTADSNNSIVVNEAFVKAYGIKDPIGKRFGKYTQQIIGVMKDFNHQSLHTTIEPLVLSLKFDTIARQSSDISFAHSPKPRISVRMKSGNIQNNIVVLRKAWQAVAPSQEFEYAFLDEKLAAAYELEQKSAAVVQIASGLSIFIACMGLFGLATLTVTRRTKEIGIRKVLGADVSKIVFLLSKDFVALVLVASLIACPVAWFSLHKWLEDFAYRIDIPWVAFIGASLTALVIALLTVSFQAVKAAISNPVKSLRTE